MMPPSVTIRGIKVRLPSTFLILGFALTISEMPANGKSRDATPAGTPSTLPPTSPMLVVPAADAAGAESQQPGKLISSEMSGSDLELLTTAVDAGREQAYFIDLLRTKANSDQLKTLAETLSSAQDEENKHLITLAAKKGWNVSMEPTAALKKVGAQLDKLKDSNYDKAVMDKLVAASNNSLSAYQTAAQSNDAQIKSFAGQMLPMAEEKRHVVEKMTGAGPKAAAQLFRHSAAPGAAAGTPAGTPPKSTPAPGKPAPLPKPAATPAAPASATPIATPPGLGTARSPQPPITSSRPPQPTIIPSKNAGSPSTPAPIPPPTSGP